MQISEKQDRVMHRLLPIDEEEKILAVYKHHWFAYVSLWVVAIVLVLVILGLSVLLVSGGGEAMTQYRAMVMAGAVLLSAFVLLFTLIPAWLKSQEHLVLTEEALLQTLQPSLFSAKTSQLNLQHVNDVTVRRDFFGTLLGYGQIMVETPGEQANYMFGLLPEPEKAAREIVSAHENYQAALQGGRMPSTLGVQNYGFKGNDSQPEIDPDQYQQFLAYQKMVEQQKQEQGATPAPTNEVASSGEPNGSGRQA